MSMADGYARATGDVPIMNLHSVAGAAYALGPMVNAFKDRIPVVVTVGRQSTDIRGTNAFLESVNLNQLPQEYTQWTGDVMNAKTIPEVVRRAFVLAQSPPGGPTFLTFSKDLWEVRVDEAEILPRERSRIEVDVAPNEEQVRRIADMLVEAEFSVIAVGKEGARFDPSEPLMELAELLEAPVFQDIYMAHGPMVFPSTHPHYAGMFRQDPSYPTDIDLYWALGGTMFGFGKLPSDGDSLGSKSHYQRTLDGRAESTHCPRRDRRERAHHVRAVRSLLLGHRSYPHRAETESCDQRRCSRLGRARRNRRAYRATRS